MKDTSARDLRRFQERQMRRQQQTVAEPVSVDVIHDEFFSAHEELQRESDAVLEKCRAILEEQSEQVVLKVAGLGFENAKNVRGHVEAIKEHRTAKQLSDYCAGYSKVYPFNKFITEKVVDSICKKYNLYICDAEKFIGEIPAKNQEDIANFQVHEEDVVKRRNMFEDLSFSLSMVWDFGGGREFKEVQLPPVAEVNCGQGEKRVGYDLRVIAPLNEINTRGMDIKNRRIMTKDPIVLQPVKGGYLIVTAWGKEANDVEVQNEKLN